MIPNRTAYGRPVGILFLGLVLFTCPLQAQDAPREANIRIAFGGGSARLSERGTSRIDLTLQGQLAFTVAERLRLGVELGLHGVNDDTPQLSDVGPGGMINRRPEVLRTISLLAGGELQLVEWLYVRPAVGFGRHSFAVYGFGATGPVSAEISHEVGPAYGVSVGTQIALVPHLGVAVEGFFVSSGGEDSTGRRRVVGLRAVPVWSF